MTSKYSLELWQYHGTELVELLENNETMLKALTIVLNNADVIDNDTKDSILACKHEREGAFLMVEAVYQKLQLEPRLINRVLDCMGTQGQLCSLSARMSNECSLQEEERG